MSIIHFPLTPDIRKAWPELPLDAWQDTYDTLHMWTQIVGKVRLKLSPLVNHWWSVALYVTSRGLTTSPIPYGTVTFEVSFDFIDHFLTIQTSTNQFRAIRLYPRSVADFYHEFMSTLHSLDINVEMYLLPSEVPDPIPFDEDNLHASYDAEYAHRCWLVLVESDRVMKIFRSRFIGKCSPVHFFWGSFDLAVTRFSGRRAPERPGADSITSEAYSHEVCSCGFWPGSRPNQDAAFYTYISPEPEGFGDAPVEPSQAWYSHEKAEFFLPYESVRQSENPDAMLLEFLKSTYEAGANLAGWDRASLERQPG